MYIYIFPSFRWIFPSHSSNIARLREICAFSAGHAFSGVQESCVRPGGAMNGIDGFNGFSMEFSMGFSMGFNGIFNGF